MVVLTPRHHQVVSRPHTATCRAIRAVVGGGPVGHDQSAESPLLSGNLGTGVIAVGGVNSVDLIVARHDGKRRRGADGNLKSLQVNFPKRTFREDRIARHTVVFLIVAGKMFDRGSDARNRLHALRDRRRHGSGDQGIFGIIFEVSAAERISVDIHARSQPERHPEVNRFMANRLADLF